ncbi:MAG TPA: BTAD domain-containing putative transcriptional regulator [Gemmatimonadales bacterium]|nr:BTAD domain-containing putative transcriptional regulator [Gemmatimonadales bacterium]
MRYLPAVLLVGVHATITAVACREVLVPERPEPGTRASAALRVAEPGSEGVSSLSVADLEALDRRVEQLEMAVQENERDVESMRALAELYMTHGWHDHAIGPLARALELEPERGDLWMALGRALERSGRKADSTDLARAAREFVAAVALRGHGC